MKGHLDVRSLLLLTKGQGAQKVEQSADLLGCEIVHVVQYSLANIKQDAQLKIQPNLSRTLLQLAHIHPPLPYLHKNSIQS